MHRRSNRCCSPEVTPEELCLVVSSVFQPWVEVFERTDRDVAATIVGASTHATVFSVFSSADGNGYDLVIK